MTNYGQLNNTMEEIEKVLAFAEGQLTESMRQEFYNEDQYTQSQMMLEEVNIQLDKLINSVQKEQKNQLVRLQQRVHQLQNKMILRM